MATKPTDKPTWASQNVTLPVAGTANKLQPVTDLRNTGIDLGQQLTAQEFNWVLDNIKSWIDYFEASTDIQDADGTGSGTSDAATATFGLTSYNSENVYWIKWPSNNQTSTPTLNIDSLGAKTVKDVNGYSLPPDSLEGGKLYPFWYDGTDFLVITDSVYGLGDELVDAADLNALGDVTRVSAFEPSTSNSPGSGHGVVFQASRGSSTIKKLFQIAWDDNGRIYRRNYDTGTGWTTWIDSTRNFEQYGIGAKTLPKISDFSNIENLESGLYYYDSTTSNLPASDPDAGGWAFVFNSSDVSGTAAGQQSAFVVAYEQETGAGIDKVYTGSTSTGTFSWKDSLWTSNVWSFSGNSSLTSDGYQVLPSGLIIQWMEVNESPDNATERSWPIAFPNTAFAAQVTPSGSSVSSLTGGEYVHSISTSGLVFRVGGSFGQADNTAYIVAWGY